MESSLLSENRLADAAQGFIGLKLSMNCPHQDSAAKSFFEKYRITCREFLGNGIVLVLSPDGAVLEKFGGKETPLERLLEGMSKAELNYGLLSEFFLTFYFSMDHPGLDPREIKDLLEKLDDDLIEVREAATARAIKGGAPAYRALNSLKSSAVSAEAGARVKQILATLEPLADRMKRPGLDRDVEFLARVMDHPVAKIRERAQARSRRILPEIKANSSTELRERWLAEKDQLRWDAQRGRYVAK